MPRGAREPRRRIASRRSKGQIGAAALSATASGISARTLCRSSGFSIRWFGTRSRKSRACAVNAPPVMNTTWRKAPKAPAQARKDALVTTSAPEAAAKHARKCALDHEFYSDRVGAPPRWSRAQHSDRGPLSGGYSGAPVIDARGELVGVVTENTEERVHGDAQPTRVTHAAPAEYIAAFTSG